MTLILLRAQCGTNLLRAWRAQCPNLQVLKFEKESEDGHITECWLDAVCAGLSWAWCCHTLLAVPGVVVSGAGSPHFVSHLVKASPARRVFNSAQGLSRLRPAYCSACSGYRRAKSLVTRFAETISFFGFASINVQGRLGVPGGQVSSLVLLILCFSWAFQWWTWPWLYNIIHL